MKKIYTPTKRKRILIVQDDQIAADIYQEKLESKRYDVEVVRDSMHVLQMLEKEPFDLAILDLSLSEPNGVKALEAVSSQLRAAGLPFIVLSNPYLPMLARAALKAGVTRCVSKSDCTPNRILAIVREVFATSAIPAKVPPGDEPAPATAVPLPVDNSGTRQPAKSAALEMEYQANLVADFLAYAPQRLAILRAIHHAFFRREEESQRLDQLFEMHLQTRLLAGAAAIVGFRKITHLASALEVLLFQLYSKPTRITPSAIRTIAQALDLLGSLCDLAGSQESEISISPAILVVDDEAVSREAICSAIGRVAVDVVSLDDPMKAEELLKQKPFDLIFLDVEMPGLSGLDLCASIRTTSTNRATPVVFVTGRSDFESWAQSRLSGGNDFIAKPLFPGELAVKALTLLFKERLQSVSTSEASPTDKSIAPPPALEAVTGCTQPLCSIPSRSEHRETSIV